MHQVLSKIVIIIHSIIKHEDFLKFYFPYVHANTIQCEIHKLLNDHTGIYPVGKQVIQLYHELCQTG